MKNFLQKNFWALLSILTFTVLYFTFYPTDTITVDENDYYLNSVLLLQGGVESLKRPCDELIIQSFWPLENGLCVSKYSIGTSILLTPLILLGKNLVFLLPFFSILTSYLALVFFLRKLNISDFWGILFLLNPVMVFYSRTLFSEVLTLGLLSITLLLSYLVYRVLKISTLKLDSYESKLGSKSRKLFLNLILSFAIGIVCAFLLWVKLTNILFLFALVVLVIIFILSENRDLDFRRLVNRIHLSQIVFSLIGFTSIIVLMLLSNQHLYGDFFSTGYVISGEQSNFNFSQLPSRLVFYFLLFNSIFPGMLVSIFWLLRRQSSYRNYAFGFLALLLLITAYFGLQAHIPIKISISGLFEAFRFFLPIYGLLIFFYSIALSDISKYLQMKIQINTRIIIILKLSTFVLLTLCALGVHLVHQNFLATSESQFRISRFENVQF